MNLANLAKMFTFLNKILQTEFQIFSIKFQAFQNEIKFLILNFDMYLRDFNFDRIWQILPAQFEFRKNSILYALQVDDGLATVYEDLCLSDCMLSDIDMSVGEGVDSDHDTIRRMTDTVFCYPEDEKLPDLKTDLLELVAQG